MDCRKKAETSASVGEYFVIYQLFRLAARPAMGNDVTSAVDSFSPVAGWYFPHSYECGYEAAVISHDEVL
jgi:hypothetical protein